MKKLKYPYTRLSNPVMFYSLNSKMTFYHDLYFYRLFIKFTKYKFKSNLELELSKYYSCLERKKSYIFTYCISIIIGFLLYIFDMKIQEINYDLVDPGKYILYKYKFFSYFREKRYKAWMFLDGGVGLRYRKEPQNNKLDSIIDIDKKEYLLALQIDNYYKKYNNKYDFISLGEQNNFKLS